MAAPAFLRAIPAVLPALVLFAACGGEAPPPAPPPPPPVATTPQLSYPGVFVVGPPPTATAAPVETAAAAATAAAPVETAKPADTAKPAEAPKPAVASRSGEAVYYDANGRGACSLTFGHDAFVLSAPNAVYNKIEACGQCLEITGPAGTAVVQVVDRCNDCADDKLVINKPAFDKIAGKASSGRERITWKPVACDVTGNLELRIKKTSSEYWTAIQVRNHRLPVKGVAFKRDDKWMDMTRSDDNYFVAAKGVGKGAMVLRITADDGQTVEQTFDKWKDGETYKGQAQFK
jgi:expansin (peptidoglycan-binding protein)